MFTDIYVLAPERSASLAVRFLDEFLPEREPAASDYQVPEYSDHPNAILTTPEEVLHYCAACKSTSQRIYWRRLGRGGDPRHAHVFFLADGGMILGLSVANECESQWERWLGQLKRFSGSGIGYYVLETPPAATSADFRRLAGCNV